MTEQATRVRNTTESKLPRVLIEDWIPAAAIGVECMRERGSSSALAPTTYLHVWWARRPLTVSRAAVLASVLPADFPRDLFERLIGFGRPGDELVSVRQMLDYKQPGTHIPIGFDCARAFKGTLREDDLQRAYNSINKLWGNNIAIIDPMAGGGSIPFESARLGLPTLANEYNPVACTVLEATVDYPIRHGHQLGICARKWARILLGKAEEQLAPYFYEPSMRGVRDYIYARTIPCPDTGLQTPLVPDWHLHRERGKTTVVAVPVVDQTAGTWRTEIRLVGRGAGYVPSPPKPTYLNGNGVSLFTGRQIPSEYIKAKAQAGEMSSTLYAIVVKNPKLNFEPPTSDDFRAIADAESQLARMRPAWERNNIIPTELYPEVSSDERPRTYGMPRWADMFSPRQLLCFGVLVEELNQLRPEIISAEGEDLGEAVVHLLAFVIDKFLNYNSNLASWHAPRAVMRSVFDRHDYAFKATFAEMAPINAGAGLEWAIDNVLEAYEELAKLPRHPDAKPVEISLGSATSMPQIEDGSITAVVVDPPYADNVQYSELADFFYVWLKRTQGHRRPEWFSTYLTEHDQEAVVNVARHREGGAKKAGEARVDANQFYEKLMAETFAECRRILRDDGVLTVMFTHKKQEAWEALFQALITAGFSISATWPVKTESEHSLHQARKNAAQSTVLLVCRKRPDGAGTGYFDRQMEREIRDAARNAADRLKGEGLNAVDQLVGAFGPAVAVYSRYDTVRTDTGMPVPVGKALDEAADAVADWRIQQLAQHGLEGVEPEGRFALLCWAVLQAAEFRFNEAKLLGHAAGMDIDQLVTAGLVTKTGDKITMVSARDRRRAKALEPIEATALLDGIAPVKRGRKKVVLQIHPNDPSFRTAIDACHAIALAYLEAGGGNAGIGAARGLIARQRWNADSPVARLMAALVEATPEALRVDPATAGKTSPVTRYPEFYTWHQLLKPLFEIEPPDWSPKDYGQMLLAVPDDDADDDEENELE